MSKILITGASGTVGTSLVETLKRCGMAFTVMTSKPLAENSGFSAVHGDFTRPETLVEAFRGVDTLFLLLPLTPDLPAMGKNAIAAAKVAGVRHVVRSSGAGADADSPFSLARVHGEIDRQLQQSGMGWTILRPTFFMQNFLTYHLDSMREGVFFAPHGDGMTALVDVADIAECAATILADPAAHASRIYTLTGSEALSNAAQLAAISAATGRSIGYVDVPESLAIEVMQNQGIPAPVVDWLMSLNAVVKAGYAAGTTGDVQGLTGHPPRLFDNFARANCRSWLAS